MDDKQLLEMAANAAGIEHEGYREFDYWPNSGLMLPSEPDIWNPMADDGDALRLAKACHFTVDFNAGIVRSPMGEILAISEIDIKRAIVRAAAALATTPTDKGD